MGDEYEIQVYVPAGFPETPSRPGFSAPVVWDPDQLPGPKPPKTTVVGFADLDGLLDPDLRSSALQRIRPLGVEVETIAVVIGEAPELSEASYDAVRELINEAGIDVTELYVQRRSKWT
ncbi:MAG TPA: hypothetical protein VH061_02055 [Solirubrobacteraceae bacterium]|jgi:hypothetical protein|nr:hypothetical protein [Solirubrobacteraceae bacterium]